MMTMTTRAVATGTPTKGRSASGGAPAAAAAYDAASPLLVIGGGGSGSSSNNNCGSVDDDGVSTSTTATLLSSTARKRRRRSLRISGRAPLKECSAPPPSPSSAVAVVAAAKTPPKGAPAATADGAEAAAAATSGADDARTAPGGCGSDGASDASCCANSGSSGTTGSDAAGAGTTGTPATPATARQEQLSAAQTPTVHPAATNVAATTSGGGTGSGKDDERQVLGGGCHGDLPPSSRRRQRQHQHRLPAIDEHLSLHVRCSAAKRRLSALAAAGRVKLPLPSSSIGILHGLGDGNGDDAGASSSSNGGNSPVGARRTEGAAAATSKDIEACVPELFGRDVPADCLSARIFALHLLLQQQQQQQQSQADYSGDGCVVNHPPSAPSYEETFVLLPILQSMVQVESVSLHEQNQDNLGSFNNGGGSAASAPGNLTPTQQQLAGEGAMPTAPCSSRKVTFCSFDCSSAAPPVDRVAGSDSYRSDAIDALISVKCRLDDVAGLGGNSGTGSTPSVCGVAERYRRGLCRLIAFLADLKGDWHLLEACAGSMGIPNYPAKRVTKFVAMYSKEFEVVLDRLRRRQGLAGDPASSGGGGFCGSAVISHFQKPLLLERRLAEFVGQAIRYNLRWLLNDTPPRLGPADTTYEERVAKYSKVASLAKMKHQSSSLAAEDECMSALVSIALQRLEEFFGCEPFLRGILQGDPLPVPEAFCDSAACRQQLSPRERHPERLSGADEVAGDVRRALAFLSAAQACRFFVGVFSCPLVQEEIERLGGWSLVETHAATSYRFDLWKICPDDSHLVVLSNHAELLAKLEGLLPRMLARVAEARLAVKRVEKDLCLNTRSQKLLKSNPWISCLREWIREGRKHEQAFPDVNS